MHCSHRFHVVSEFDDSKRSCRRRLAGHNERRRKTSHDSAIRNVAQGILFTNDVSLLAKLNPILIKELYINVAFGCMFYMSPSHVL